MNAIRVLARGLRFPEGPAFDADGRLWCVEQEGESLHCWERNGATHRIHTGGRPNGAVVRDDYLWFCDSGYNAIRRLHLPTGQLETVLDRIAGQPLSNPNDLSFDELHNLVFTCPGPAEGDHLGSVAIYRPNGSAEIIADGLDYPNGLAWLPGASTLLIGETHRQRIWCGYWDGDALSWENLRVWTTVVEAPNGEPLPGPDGMCVGPDGNLYVTVFGVGQVRVFSPDGQFLRAVDLPGRNPTNCIFDPTGDMGLIVTETERGELLCVSV